jgi:CRP-like cAMP-binding protein
VSESETEAASILPAAAVEALLRAGQLRTVPVGTRLFEEGQTITSFFVVTCGELEVVQTVEGPCTSCGPGSILGLMAALDGGPCRVSVQARGDVTVVEIGRDILLAMLEDLDVVLACSLARIAIRRLRKATDELAHVLYQAVSSTSHPGKVDKRELVSIQAKNHIWPGS